MRGIRLSLLGVLTAGLLALPGAAVAQDDPTSPEGVDWKLTGYLDPEAESNDDGEIVELSGVPLGVMATLRLEGGLANGSGGCNTFGGTYTLDGTALSFADVLSTLVACPDEDVQAIEDAYLLALPEVRSWLISSGVLELADETGTTRLAFEVPDISLTTSELAGLVATLETLGTDIAGLREDIGGLDDDVAGLGVARLRERLRALETTTQRLGRERDARPEATPQPTGGFNAAERVLLKAIPGRIAGRCEPLRSGRPAGTRAAVTCKPDTSLVSGLDYFLMEGADAASVFAATMAEHDVLEATSEDTTCAAGRRSQQVYIADGWQAEGCYRSGGRAHLRFVDNATDCRQLPVGDGRRLRNPALFMAVTGTGNDIARLHTWAGGTDDAALTRLSQHIESSGQPRSPSCAT